MTPVELFLSRVPKHKKQGKSWQACCPAHNDKSPSLTISEADNGDLLLHCFAGCEYRDIMAAVGLEAREGFQGSLSPEAKREYQRQTLTKAKQFEELVINAAANADELSDEDVARLATAQRRIKEIDAQLHAPAPVFSRGAYNLLDPLPFCTDKGKPLKHIENLKEIINRTGVTLRYNVIAKEEEIIIPMQSFSMDNQANAALAWLKSECTLFRFPTEHLDGMVTYLSDQNQYNPVAEWILSKHWDGVSRMQSLYDTVRAKDEFAFPQNKSLKETLIKRWMMSAVAAAFLPDGVSAAGVLVFQGPQYLGKTKWFKQLVPESLGLLKDGMLLRPDDKDSVKQICSFWLVELGELDSTFRKADIAALKSFITSKSDVLRRAYARKESHYARRTVFFGSVNPREFLHDTTGNRRYWTIECEELDHSHGIDMQQCWAEAYDMWKKGEGWYLEPDEMEALNSNNEQFMALDPIEERIRQNLDWDASDANWRWEQVTMVLLEVGIDRPTRADANTAGSIIRKLNGNRGKRSNGKTLLFCPAKKY